MRLTPAALAVLVLVAPVPAARADFPRLGIFRKKQKEEPPQRIKQLLDTLKSDPDEKKRAAAVAELRDHDPRNNADLLPTLVNTLQRDPSAAVRAGAAETIGRLKPVSQQAGVALEQTQTADPTEEVRKAAGQALWDYHLNGYRSAGANPAYPQTAEPPPARPRPAGGPRMVVLPAKPGAAPPRPITSGIGKGAIHPQTVEPPLAKSKSRPVEAVAPPTPTLIVPPVTKEEPAKPIPVPVPAAPAAPTVPAGPTVPTIRPPK